MAALIPIPAGTPTVTCDRCLSVLYQTPTRIGGVVLLDTLAPDAVAPRDDAAGQGSPHWIRCGARPHPARRRADVALP